MVRSYLKIDENGYNYVSPLGHSNSRDYYIYSVLDEVEKAGISLMNYSEFILGTKAEINGHKSDDSNRRMERNIYSSIVDQMSVWIRKLTEILVEVIGFKKINNNNYFKHYILVHELTKNNRLKTDFNFYFSCKNRNIDFQIENIKTEISEILKTIDQSKCWYVDIKKKTGLATNNLSNFGKRLQELLPSFSPDHKLTIGTSYQSYSSVSGNLHNSIVDKEVDMNMGDVDAYFGQIAILSAHILLVCKDLLGKKPKKGFLSQINRVIKKNDFPGGLLMKITNPKIKVGDFVIAYGDIAEVIKVNKSKFGYKSFRVKYLGNPPLPGISEDEFAARYIKIYKRKIDIVPKIREIIMQNTPNFKVNNKKILDSVRKTLLESWEEMGFKERAYGRIDLAQKKLQEFIAKHNPKQNIQ